VKRNPQPLVDTIAPLLGPAMRQAAADALGHFSQRISQTLTQWLSLRSMRWRFEAWRTGRPFAEIALSHTLLYRVEQLFLVHKKTGQLLQYVGIAEEGVQDADMVNGMLSAIKSFVQNPAGMMKDNVLESFQIGELTVDVEQGREAFLAAVIRGNPPRRLRRVFVDALGNIHLECARELEGFRGDTTPFVACRPYLEECLQVQTDAQQARRSRRSHPWVLRLFLLGVGALLGWWGYQTLQDRWQWSAYLERLKAEPGVVVIASERRQGKWFVNGLRDPLATDPDLLLQEVGIDSARVVSRWELYQALQPQFILQRAKAMLAPPESVTLQYENGILTAVGTASRQWVEDARRLARALPGVTNFVESFKETATANVAAKNATPRSAQSNAQESQRSELATAKERLEQQSVQFLVDTLDLMSDQESTLKEIAGTIRILLAAAQFVGQPIKIEVIGHADANGAPLGDQVLGLTRAERVIAELSRNGLTQSDLAILKASVDDLPQGQQTSGAGLQGKVSFRVKLLDKS
jgi:outer membrane protein OmpA-like peptidoglycan-associated protein